MKLPVGRLVLIFIVAVAAWLVVLEYGRTTAPHPLEGKMMAAARRTKEAFAVVDSVKRARGYRFPGDSPIPWKALLGEDYTPMTTTLGSLAAKEVSTNPAWAPVLVRLLSEAGVEEGDTVAVMLSASFPALAVASMAAVRVLGASPLLISSLGASSYGANVRGATWLDWERWLGEAGVMDIRSALVTPGGEQDIALGMPAEGVEWIEEAALRSGRSLTRYPSLVRAIEARMDLMVSRQVSAIVNIGGGQASLGACPHAAGLPVGLWKKAPGCSCPDRGVLTRAAQAGLPVIHLLQVRRLAAFYGLDFEPGSRYADAGGVTTVTHVRPAWVVAALCAVAALTVISRRRKQ
jgi:poly-gamma-glutamate system protein